MSNFECLVVLLTIEPHPNADKLEVARVKGYSCVVGKNQYKTGDLAVYFPIDSMIPKDILKELDLTGALKGPEKNRVKMVKLRGTVSEGILYPINGKKITNLDLKEGDDVANILKVTKFSQPIPKNLKGKIENISKKVQYVNVSLDVKFDVEALKKYPRVLNHGEPICISEKLHGTNLRCTHINNEIKISTKRLGNLGQAFSTDEKQNTYVLMYAKYEKEFTKLFAKFKNNVVVIGEIFGNTIQDMSYGTDPDLRIFDIWYDGKFLNTDQVLEALKDTGLTYVPILYRGPWDESLLDKYVSGKSLIPTANCMMEGIVIRPDFERIDTTITGRFEGYDSRVILKVISNEYHLRKHGTELE